MADPPELVTIPNVEILEVGEDWALSNGVFTFTDDDVASAVDATADPAIRTPVIKLGHTDPRFDGTFSIGRVENMHLANGGMTLVGDYVGVPKWLAAIMPSAYPRRSMEGRWDTTTATGRRWPFYIEAVALLGAMYPGITTLEDIEDFFYGNLETWVPEGAAPTAAASSLPDDPEGGIMATITRLENPMPWKRTPKKAAAATPPANPAATIETDDVRRQFYDDPPGSWWWIRAIQLDPMQIIADDDEGNLYRVPFSISGDVVTFEDPVEVSIVYQDAAAAAATHAPAASGFAAPEGATVTYPTREAARAGIVLPDDPATPEGNRMTPEQLAQIGLAPDADEATITARLAELVADPTAPAPTAEDTADDDAPAVDPPAPVVDPAVPAPVDIDPANLPEGTVLVDAATFAQVSQNAAAGAAAAERLANARRDETINAAIRDGKITRARAGHWRDAWKADAAGAEAALAGLQKGLIPVSERGSDAAPTPDDPSAAVGETAYNPAWFPEAGAKRAAAGLAPIDATAKEA